MINIFLAAKAFAMTQDADVIKMIHIKKALESLLFLDAGVETKVMGQLEFAISEKAENLSEADLQSARAADALNFDDEVKAFKKALKEMGLTTALTATELYVADQFAQNAEKLIALGAISETLSGIIYDQEIAIESVKDTISRAIFEEREDAVKAILFFVGPPATGKTFLAEETGKLLEEHGYTTKVFNMTMYSEDTSNLAGLAEPRVGAGKGDLTKFVEKHPKSLIVLDEIEKCHPEQQRNLFRLLDRGYIEDKFDNSITKANDCILIFTSNLGKEIYDRNDYTTMIHDQKETESLILDAIAKEKSEYNKDILAITPPLTSRLSAAKIVLFNKVGLKAYFQMSKKEIERYFGVLEAKFGVKLECSDEAILSTFLRYLPFFDPRRIKGKIGDDLFDSVRDYVQSEKIPLSDFKQIVIDVDVNTKEFLQQNFVQDIGQHAFNDSRFQELIDKKQTLFVQTAFVVEQSQLRLVLKEPRIEKIKNIQDFSGDVKIELDIPSGKIKGEPNAKIFGHDEAKKMLVRISDKIQRFQELQRTNDPKAKEVLDNIPKGILLYGPPGTGKTKIARAFAAQVECPIIVTSGKEMTTMQLVGTGVQKIKEIFNKAREYAPSVLFIDEIDAIGTRGSDMNSAENNKNINTLLEELDGFNRDAYKPVFIIAATNRKDTIDPAIIRPGRIEEHIEIGPLDKDARIAFIQNMFANDACFSNEIDAHQFLKYTAGMSGAQLEQVFKKAKYNMEIRREEKNDKTLQVDLTMLIDIVNEIRFGKVNKTRADAKFETMLTAYHEAGHAVVSMALNPSLPIEQITITSRADFGGFVSYNHEEILRWDKRFFIGKIAAAYAGRVSEEIYFTKNSQPRAHGISSGASSDIKQATRLIQEAVLRLGMDSELGLINYDEMSLSEATKSKIDATVLHWQKQIRTLTQQVIEANWENIEKIVFELVGSDTKEGNETLDSNWLKENIEIDMIDMKDVLSKSIA